METWRQTSAAAEKHYSKSRARSATSGLRIAAHCRQANETLPIKCIIAADKHAARLVVSQKALDQPQDFALLIGVSARNQFNGHAERVARVGAYRRVPQLEEVPDR